MMQEDTNSESKKSKSSLFRNKLYRRLYSSYGLSSLGDWFDMLAIQVLVGYRWQAGPFMLAMIPIAMALPGILLGSVAGAAVDRWDKLKLMRICDLLTAILTVAIIAVPNMMWLLPLLMVRAAVGSLKAPAQQSLTRAVVEEDQLLQATSLNSIVNQGSKIAGPLLGGMALSVLAPQWCIALNAVLRLCSYILIMGKSLPEQALDKAQSESVSQEKPQSFASLWREGWSYIFRNKLLRSTMIFGFAGSLAVQTIDFQFTSLFRDLAPQKEYLLGWFIAAAGAGALLIMMILMRYNRGKGYGWKLGTGSFFIGASILGLGLLQVDPPLLQLLLLGVLLGLGNGIFMITFHYCLQKESTPEMTGRVFGIQQTVLNAVMIGAPPIGGLWAEKSGSGSVFFWIGLAVAIIGCVGLLLSKWLWPTGSSQQSESLPTKMGLSKKSTALTDTDVR